MCGGAKMRKARGIAKMRQKKRLACFRVANFRSRHAKLRQMQNHTKTRQTDTLANFRVATRGFLSTTWHKSTTIKHRANSVKALAWGVLFVVVKIATKANHGR